jgi:hypothetical protein
MLAARFAGRPIFVRELLPQDLKIEIAQLTRIEAMRAATFLAGVVGQGHARQMDPQRARHGNVSSAAIVQNPSMLLLGFGRAW